MNDKLKKTCYQLSLLEFEKRLPLKKGQRFSGLAFSWFLVKNADWKVLNQEKRQSYGRESVVFSKLGASAKVGGWWMSNNHGYHVAGMWFLSFLA